MIDYLNDLREGCLEAYTGIIQGMKGEGSPAAPTAELAMVQPHVTHIVQVLASGLEFQPFRDILFGHIQQARTDEFKYFAENHLAVNLG